MLLQQVFVSCKNFLHRQNASLCRTSLYTKRKLARTCIKTWRKKVSRTSFLSVCQGYDVSWLPGSVRPTLYRLHYLWYQNQTELRRQRYHVEPNVGVNNLILLILKHNTFVIIILFHRTQAVTIWTEHEILKVFPRKERPVALIQLPIQQNTKYVWTVK